MRLDKYLKVSRLIKRRTVANDACDGGRVSLNGKTAKASAEVKAGDVIEVWNDFGSTYAMAYPMKSIKPGHTFMLFGYIKGVAGDVVTSWVDRNVVPYYKGTWASVQRVGSVEDWKQSISFKERRYS